MKKTVSCILLSALLFAFASCDRSHLCALDVLCLNENVTIAVDGQKSDSFNFSSNEFNQQPLENYTHIDFTAIEDNSSNAKVYKFGITSMSNDTYNLSLKLIDSNEYVIDFLRVGIVIDGELRVYKYYDKHEELYHKENDPDSILYFNSKSEIFNESAVNFSASETKDIIVFIWIEEAELYDNNGERYKGWKDKSYYCLLYTSPSPRD